MNEFPFGSGPDQDPEIQEEVRRFEEMLRGKGYHFFDAFQLEDIFFHYLHQHQLSRALSVAEYAIEKFPELPDFLHKKATILLDQGKFQEAMASINLALEKTPGQIEYILLKSEILTQQGFHDDALYVLEHTASGVAALESHFGELLMQLGSVSRNARRLEQAIAYYERALDENPLFEDALFEIVDTLELSGDTPRAIARLNRYLDDHPDNPFVWLTMGNLYSKYGWYELGVEAFDFAIAAQDDFASAYFGKGMCYRELGNVQEALKCYLEVQMHEQPYEYATLYNIGECYEQLGEYALAFSYYQKCTEHFANQVDGWVGAGFCMEQQEKFKEAIYFYRKAIGLDEEHSEAWVSLANAEFKLGNGRAAYEALTEAIRLNPSDTQMWTEWAEMLHEEGNTEGSVTFLEEGIRHNPESADLHYHLAAYLFQLNQRNKACHELENALLLKYQRYPLIFDIFAPLRKDPSVLELVRLYRDT